MKKDLIAQSKYLIDMFGVPMVVDIDPLFFEIRVHGEKRLKKSAKRLVISDRIDVLDKNLIVQELN